MPKGKTEQSVTIKCMSDSRKGSEGYVSDKVVPYETMLDEAKRRQCQNRLRKREAWPRDTQEAGYTTSQQKPSCHYGSYERMKLSGSEEMLRAKRIRQSAL